MRLATVVCACVCVLGEVVPACKGAGVQLVDVQDKATQKGIHIHSKLHTTQKAPSRKDLTSTAFSSLSAS